MSLRGSIRALLCCNGGVNVEAALNVREVDDTFSIRIASGALPQDVEGAGESLFDALSAARRILESLGWLIRCAGAQVNVFPSPMIRSMGDGDRAYALTLGQPARVAELVDILRCDALYIPSTVEEQETFYETWVQSLRVRR